MKLLSLDIATKITGYCIFVDGFYHKSGVIDSTKYSSTWIPKGEGRTESERQVKKAGKVKNKPDNKCRADRLHNRLIYQKEKISAIVNEYKIDYVIKELPIFAVDKKTALELGEAHAVITTMKIPIICYYPTEWRSTIKKHVTKNKIPTNLLNFVGSDEVKHLKKLLKEESKINHTALFFHEHRKLPITNDEADAYCMGFHHIFYDKTMFSYQNTIENNKKLMQYFYGDS